MKYLTRIAIALTASVVFITPALAHPGHGGDALGFSNGFLHPLSGLDHVLAMIAVGMYAVQLGGRALWRLPLAFAAAMVLGSEIGLAGIEFPMVEQTIALSVIAVGVAIALGIKIPIKIATVLVAAFALFHGHAHGSEGAATTTFLSYVAGFSTATCLLLTTGIAIGHGLSKFKQSQAWFLRGAMGASGTVAGIVLLAS